MVLSLIATLGVVLFGVLQGIVIAIVLAVLLFFRRSWWPHGAVLGEIDGLDGWHSIEGFPDAGARRHRRVPMGGAAVLRERRRVPPPGP